MARADRPADGRQEPHAALTFRAHAMSTLHTQPAVLDALGGVDPYSEFRVQHPREIAALLKELTRDAIPVILSGPGGVSLTTVVWTVDTAQQRINFSAD